MKIQIRFFKSITLTSCFIFLLFCPGTYPDTAENRSSGNPAGQIVKSIKAENFRGAHVEVLRFFKTPVNNVIKFFSQKSGLKFEIHPEIAGIKITGKFQYQPWDMVLFKLLETYKLDITHDKGKVLISRLKDRPAIPTSPVVLANLIKPDSINISSNFIYITEKETVHIYQLSGFKFLTSIGAKGQGPEEFQLYRTSLYDNERISISFQNQDLVVGSVKKVSYWTKKGGFKREFPFSDPLAFAVAPVRETFVGVVSDRRGLKNWYFSFNIYNTKGEKINQICSLKRPLHSGSPNSKNMALVFINQIISPPQYRLAKNRILISDSSESVIYIYDISGRLINKIEPKPAAPIIDNRVKKEILKIYRDNIGPDLWPQARKTISVPGFFPKFRTIIPVDDHIYAQTYNQMNGRTEFLVFSLTGEFVRSFFIRLKYRNLLQAFPYTIVKNILYQLVEDGKNEAWTLEFSQIPEL